MHFLAALSLDGFYVATLQTETSMKDLAVVVVKDKWVVDASKPARSLGITVGQAHAEARAILGKQGSFVDWKEGRFTKASEAWLTVASRYTGFVEPLSEHEALLDLSGHPDPLRTASELKQVIEGMLPVSASVGIGSCRWIAKASCRAGLLSIDPLRTPRAFIRPLSTLCLEPVEWRDRERLMALGYRTIGEVASIPYTTLAELFGKRTFTISRAAQGGGDPRVKPLFPKGIKSDIVCFSTAPENWQEIEEASKRLARRLGTALSRADLAAHDVELVATFEDGSHNSKSRTFTRPLETPEALVRSLSLLLREPFEKPVERLLMRLKNLERSSRVQRSFEGFVENQNRDVALRKTLQNLNATFGAGIVANAGELPLQRYQEVRRAWQEANGWAWR